MKSVIRLCAVLAIVVACASDYAAQRQARKALGDGDPAAAAAILEQERDRSPRNTSVRNGLGEAYYKRARKALDERRLADYEADLARALDEWVESVRIDPESPAPHNWMGIVAAYQGDLDSALLNFNNARKLEPLHPVYSMNIAQVYTYKGELGKARRWIEAARRKRALPIDLELLSMQAAWRANDMVEALDLFEGAYALDPDEVTRWAGDAAEIPEPIESFDDYARYCCGSPGCGPFMEDACHAQELEVKRRQVSEETVRRELLLEMERRRKLDAIYRERRDLEITIPQRNEETQ